MDKKIRHIITAIQFRLCLTQLCEHFPYFLLAGTIPAFVCALTGYLFPWYYANIAACALLFAGFMAGLAAALRKLPSARGAAHAADRLIGHDRALTALELCGQNSVVVRLQKEDALQRLETLNFKESFPFRLRILPLCSALLLLSLSVMFSLLPSESRQLAARQHELNENRKKETAALEEIQEALAQERETPAEPEEKTGAAALPDNIYEDLQSTLANIKDSFQEAASEKDLAYGREYLSAKMQNYIHQTASAKQAQEALQEIAETYGLADPNMLAEASKQEDHNPDSDAGDSNADGDGSSDGNGSSGGDSSSDGDGSSGSDGTSESTSASASENISGNTQKNDSDYETAKTAQKTQGGQSFGQNASGGSQSDGSTADSDGHNSSGSTTDSDSQNSDGSTKDGDSQNRDGSAKDGGGQNSSSGKQSNSNGNTSQNGNGKNSGNKSGSGKNYGSKYGVERKTSLDNDAEKITIMDNAGSGEASLEGSVSENGNSTKTSSDKERKAGVKQELGSVIASYQKNANAAISNNKVPSEMSELVRSYFNQFNESK